MKEYIRINKLAYDALCLRYDERTYRRSQFEESPETLGSAVLRHLTQNLSLCRALEVGPGSGEMLAFFERNHCRTVAVELSPQMAKIAKVRSPNTVFVVADISECEFLADQFEIIYAGALIHLFPLQDALDILQKFHTWLAPNGVLSINTTIHPKSNEGFLVKSDYGIRVKRFRRKWTEEEFREALVTRGFKILARLFTDERDRGKQWVAFICTKRTL